MSEKPTRPDLSLLDDYLKGSALSTERLKTYMDRLEAATKRWWHQARKVLRWYQTYVRALDDAHDQIAACHQQMSIVCDRDILAKEHVRVVEEFKKLEQQLSEATCVEAELQHANESISGQCQSIKRQLTACREERDKWNARVLEVAKGYLGEKFHSHAVDAICILGDRLDSCREELATAREVLRDTSNTLNSIALGGFDVNALHTLAAMRRNRIDEYLKPDTADTHGETLQSVKREAASLLRFAHYGEEYPHCMEDGEPNPSCAICKAIAKWEAADTHGEATDGK